MIVSEIILLGLILWENLSSAVHNCVFLYIDLILLLIGLRNIKRKCNE